VMLFKGKPISEDYMRNINPAEVRTIYFLGYWQSILGGSIKSQPVATCVFDTGVNRGPSIAARLTQQILNAVCLDKNAPLAALKVDGMLGPQTLLKLNSVDPRVFIEALVNQMKDSYRDIVFHDANKAEFLKGWLNRADRMLTLINVS